MPLGKALRMSWRNLSRVQGKKFSKRVTARLTTKSNFLLTVSAIGVGLFGLLTFENSQQGFMALMKGMPDSMANTEMGAAFKRTPFIVFRLANLVLVTLIAVAQIIQVN